MDQAFTDTYARVYDLLYADKDYDRECDILEGLFDRLHENRVARLLDLGCGTGKHATNLARRGYEVLGVDASETMVRLARESSDGDVDFEQGDLRTFRTGPPFDAVLMMFAVLSYQLSNEDVSKALRTVRDNLKQGGIFIADLWYGPAVLAQRPSDRVKSARSSEETVIRAATGHLNTSAHVCHVRYQTWHFAGGRLKEDVSHHAMRFFFPLELRLMLDVAGLELLSLTGSPEDWTTR